MKILCFLILKILSQYHNLMTPSSTNKEDVLKDATSSKNNTTEKEAFKHKILNLRENGKCGWPEKKSLYVYMIQGFSSCPTNILLLTCITVKKERHINICLKGGGREEIH